MLPFTRSKRTFRAFPSSNSTRRNPMSKNRLVLLTIFCCALAAVSGAVIAQKQQYPQTRKVDHVDSYHGTSVPDPYRWLEDDNSAETANWVEEQNKLTFAYLNQIPYRAK